MDGTFYDCQGTPIAYTEDGIHIYLFSGQPVAYLDQGSIYSYSGKHLGRFESGWMRDNKGACVCFTQDAQGGPLKPLRQMKPMKGIKAMKPLKSLKDMKPLKPLNQMVWSELSGQVFFD